MAAPGTLFLFFFLPVFTGVYLLSDRKIRPTLLLGAGLFLGAWCFTWVFAAMFFSAVVQFALLRWMSPPGGNTRFLYYTALVWAALPALLAHLILPHQGPAWMLAFAALAMFTLRSLAWVIEVRHQKIRMPAEPLPFLLHQFFFPAFLIGPFTGPAAFLHQYETAPSQDQISLQLSGLLRFVTGLAKLLLIGSILQQPVDVIFSPQAGDYTLFTNVTGTLFFAFQLYFQLSGISDMGKGLAALYGYELPEQFRAPLMSASLTAFRRRWFAPLTTWMKTYLFSLTTGETPLRRLQVALAALCISAAVWSAHTGILLWFLCMILFAIPDAFILHPLRKKAAGIPGWLITGLFLFLSFGILRQGTWQGALHYLEGFTQLSAENYTRRIINYEHLAVLALAMLIVLLESPGFVQKWREQVTAGKLSLTGYATLAAVSAALLYMCLAAALSSGTLSAAEALSHG